MAHAYTDATNLKRFLGADLTDNLAALKGSTASEVLQQAITEATDEIDAALAQRYAVPLPDYSTGNTPAIVVLLCNCLAAANLLEKRYPESPVGKRMRERADTIMARLLSGDYEIPQEQYEEDADTAGAGVMWSGSSATFANGGMDEW